MSRTFYVIVKNLAIVPVGVIYHLQYLVTNLEFSNFTVLDRHANNVNETIK